jgi:hypothetical protein
MECFGTITYSSTANRYTDVTKTFPASFKDTNSLVVYTWLQDDIDVNSVINWSYPMNANTWLFQETALDANNLTAVLKTAYFRATGRYK